MVTSSDENYILIIVSPLHFNYIPIINNYYFVSQAGLACFRIELAGRLVKQLTGCIYTTSLIESFFLEIIVHAQNMTSDLNLSRVSQGQSGPRNRILN